MTRPRVKSRIAALAAVTLFACIPAWGGERAQRPDDAPETRPAAMSPSLDAPTYAEALRTWRTPEEMAAWLGARFAYDRSRAVLLSESARALAAPPVRTAAEFFATPSGVCVDLARFGVESLKAIDPSLQPTYLMIEFEPVTLDGQTLRRHWVAAYRRDGGWFVFADSKRPGHVAGPYTSLQAYVDEYAGYRQRPVVAFRTLDTFERRLRSATPRATRTVP